MLLKLKRLSNNVDLPEYKTDGAVGLDLQTSEKFVLEPHSRLLVNTGIAVSIPKGYEMQIRPRSGNALKYGMTVLNSPGTIDSDYRGEIKVLLYNTSDVPLSFNVGDRIAQAVINKVEIVQIQEVMSLDETTRGDDGFGSTGI